MGTKRKMRYTRFEATVLQSSVVRETSWSRPDKVMVNELLTVRCNIQRFTEDRGELGCRASEGVGQRQNCDESPVRVISGWGE